MKPTMLAPSSAVTSSPLESPAKFPFSRIIILNRPGYLSAPLQTRENTASRGRGQTAALHVLHDRTKVPVAVYIREGIDLVLAKYSDQLPGQLSLVDTREKK